MNRLQQDINEAAYILKKGGVVIFPTDTVYGIGTLPEKECVDKLYKIKKRDTSKKIIALIDNIEKIDDLIDEKNKIEIEEVLKNFWPGELTVIFKANKKFVKKFDSSMDTIGIRIPGNETARNIIKKSGGVILTTSANISGEKSVKYVKDINSELLLKVDYVLEDNSLPTGTPSTVIKYEKGNIELIREGNIEIKDIKKFMKG